MRAKPRLSSLLAPLLAAASLALGLSGAVLAAPVPSGLSISATITMDLANSSLPTGSGTQSGTLTQSLGGVDSSSSFTDDPSTLSSAVQGGTLTQTGDGVGALFQMSGLAPQGGSATSGTIFADYLLNLSNSSATETFTVVFQVDAFNSVTAGGPDGFAFSSLVVQDNAASEVFATDYRIDTLNASDPNVNTMFDSPTNTFTVVLAPGASASFTAVQAQRGGANTENQAGSSSYQASLDTSITLLSIRGSDEPNTELPLPGSLPLLALGLLAAATARLRRAR